MFRLTGCSPETTIGLCIAKGWELGATCGSCRHAVRTGLAQLAGFPAAATLAQIAERARCAECGSAEGLLYTANAAHKPGMGHSA